MRPRNVRFVLRVVYYNEHKAQWRLLRVAAASLIEISVLRSVRACFIRLINFACYFNAPPPLRSTKIIHRALLSAGQASCHCIH